MQEMIDTMEEKPVWESAKDDYTFFGHTFTVGVGPEGVIIWQSWGEHGYTLPEYIARGGARVRNWQEAGDWVDRFDKLTQHKVCPLPSTCHCKSLTPSQRTFDAKRNKLYEKCFEVDMFEICGSDGPSKPIVPEYNTWVRQMVFEDVKLEDIYKFTFA